ncbi:aa3-type cytochrome c oxidase subunit IV [Phaeobacter sp. HF9A]|nr:aa3-type cytochrome c oxidase subunit IV [Phaeobacter sp. HF9A]NIZ12460.1 aa3-type cytochrome c oxidase subunit IV [Phaeobacter sp. HF9A]
MAEHKHGTMDTSVQEQTFNSFMTFVSRFCIFLVCFGIFLAVFAS